jgi:hypothetical protein
LQRHYGILPRALNGIFTSINKIMEKENPSSVDVKANYYEICDDKMNDLLSATPTQGQNLKLRMTPGEGIAVVNDNPKFITGF